MPPDHEHTKTPPQYVTQLQDRLELTHQNAREELGQSVEHAKKQYDKNVARIHNNVGDTVWYLINRIKWVRDKVMKPLPSYKGPYVIQTQAVQLQDDSRQQLGVHTRRSMATCRDLVA